MSGRQRADTQRGSAWWRILQPFLVLSVSRAGGQGVSKTASIASTLCLPDVTTCDQISQTFPSVFAYCKRSKTGVGKAWEWGYMCAWHILSMWISTWLHVGQFGEYPFCVCTCPTYLCTTQISTWLADVTHGIFSFSDLHVLVVTLPLPLSLRTIVLPGWQAHNLYVCLWHVAN